MAEEKEAPRLYSTRSSKRPTPVDDIAPQHQDVHEKLRKWGAWNSTRSARRGLASAEGLYSKAGLPPATAPLEADPDIMSVERAVIRMPKAYAETLRMMYVKRYSSYTICRALKLRYESFSKWTFTCRAMVMNLMRRHG